MSFERLQGGYYSGIWGRWKGGAKRENRRTSRPGTDSRFSKHHENWCQSPRRNSSQSCVFPRPAARGFQQSKAALDRLGRVVRVFPRCVVKDSRQGNIVCFLPAPWLHPTKAGGGREGGLRTGPFNSPPRDFRGRQAPTNGTRFVRAETRARLAVPLPTPDLAFPAERIERPWAGVIHAAQARQYTRKNGDCLELRVGLVLHSETCPPWRALLRRVATDTKLRAVGEFGVCTRSLPACGGFTRLWRVYPPVAGLPAHGRLVLPAIGCLSPALMFSCSHSCPP